MMHISIPKPCHEDWAAMTPNEQGRHCNVCCKTVVDFTNMNDDEVKYFFINKKKEETVCGRFKNEQLQRINITLPYSIYTISMPLWKRFLTACLLAFSSMLFSCNALVQQNDIMGESLPAVTQTDTTKSSLSYPQRMGAPEIQIDTTLQPVCLPLMGDIEVVSTITQGVTIAEPVAPVAIPDTIPEAVPDTLPRVTKGEMIIDSTSYEDLQTIDSAKTSTQCDNRFINL